MTHWIEGIVGSIKTMKATKPIMIKALKKVRFLNFYFQIVMEQLADHKARLASSENTIVLLKAMGGSGSNADGSGPDLLDAL
jgi:hypothetical protein